MANLTLQCSAPEGETKKSFIVRNDRGTISYLAKSQMRNVIINYGTMTFTASDWFHNIHPWLDVIDGDVI